MAQNAAASVSEALSRRLASRTTDDPFYWDFRGTSRRSHGHGLLPYPAMMVPQLQGALLDDLLAVAPATELIYDPFAGSGTVLTESMRRGLSFIGGDLNPLAVMAMSVKAEPPSVNELQACVDEVLALAIKDGVDDSGPATSYGRLAKWFSPEAYAGLSRLRFAILQQRSLQVRRFLWTCLAVTVRLTSNSRTSTFKLHAYAAEDLRGRTVDPQTVFARVGQEARNGLIECLAELGQNGLLRGGRYLGDVHLLQGDVMDSWVDGHKADVLMTSPPYGDNRTTVPYGQYSFLQLLWIDPSDWWDSAQAQELLASPYRIDHASLGGGSRPHLSPGVEALSDRSESFAEIAGSLAVDSPDGLKRLVAFTADLDRSIERIEERLAPGAIQFWTLGNRRICGRPVPTSSIVRDLIASRGGKEVLTIERRFPPNAKRMATRNAAVSLMNAEHIVVMQSPPCPKAPHKPGAERATVASVAS